jgi:hypothetical protein
MVVEAKQNDKVTISFSGSVGTNGIKRIKNYVEFLELNATSNSLPEKNIKNLADTITTAAWQKMKKKKQMQ